MPVTLKPDFTRGTVELDEQKPPQAIGCQHLHVTLRTHTQDLECDHCGQIISPYEFILSWTRKANRWKMMVAHYKREADQAAEKVERLRKDIRNAHAKLRRLQEKTP